MQKSACLLFDASCNRRALRATPTRVEVGRAPRAWRRAAETQARSKRNRQQGRYQVVGDARVAVLTWEQMGLSRAGVDATYQSSSAADTHDKLLSAMLRSMIGMSDLALETMMKRRIRRERRARLVSNVHPRTKVPRDEPDEPSAAAQLEDVQALEGFPAPGNVARQNLQ